MHSQAVVNGNQSQFQCGDAGVGHDMWEQDAGYPAAWGSPIHQQYL